MDNQIKFNDEEIKKVTSFQQQYNDLQRNFGSLSLNKIKLKEQLEEINKAKHDLEVGLLRAHIKSIESSHSRVEAALKVENENLTKVALDRPTDMRMWFAAGGFAVGIATTLLIGWLTVSAQAGFQ